MDQNHHPAAYDNNPRQTQPTQNFVFRAMGYNDFLFLVVENSWKFSRFFFSRFLDMGPQFVFLFVLCSDAYFKRFESKYI